MDLDLSSTLSVSSIYLAILGLLFVPLTMRIGMHRIKHKIDIGDDGDKQLFRMIRCQANFVETVPLAAILIVALELSDASEVLIHIMGATLVVSRIMHYLGLSRLGPFIARPLGMAGTFTVYIVSSAALLYLSI